MITDEEAKGYAVALQEFCKATDCRECPFGKPSEYTDRVICKLTDYEDPPCGWELDEVKSS